MKELPYIFDLLWDIKEEGRLKQKIIIHLGEAVSMLETIEDTGIILDEKTNLYIKTCIDKLRTFV